MSDKPPTAAPPAASAPTSSANGSKRRVRLIVFGVLVAAGGIAWTAWWFVHGRYFEETDDAYVANDLIPVSSEVAGTVIGMHADDTQQVDAGQVLVELDPADAKVAVASAEAELARSVRQVRTLYSQATSVDAQIREREVALQAARGDLKRREAAAKEGAVSAEELQHARDQVAGLTQALDALHQNRESAHAQVENTTIATHPQVLAAAARLRDASLALRRTRVVSPVAGMVARRTVQIGSRIAPGMPLLAVVPLDQAWVDANFKEVQLARMRIGQPVDLESDLYGGGFAYHGRIAGVGAGSGSAFALLPPQNASGNWTKVVQRVPVRIALDPKELASHPLRVGLSMTASVDLHDTSGPMLAKDVRSVPVARLTTVADDEAVDRRIAAIIAANAGAASSTPASVHSEP